MKYVINTALLIALAVYFYLDLGGGFFERATASHSSFTARVASVIDGDTVRLATGAEEFKVELIGIDAPEIGQPFGDHSRQYLLELITNSDLRIDLHKPDRFGTAQAELFLNGVSINKLLLRDGFAWARKGLSRGSEWKGLEILARKQNFGLWRNYDPVPPWKFREGEITDT